MKTQHVCVGHLWEIYHYTHPFHDRKILTLISSLCTSPSHHYYNTHHHHHHHHQCVSIEKCAVFYVHIIIMSFHHASRVNSYTWIQHQIFGLLHPSDHQVIQETSQQEKTLHGLWKHWGALGLPSLTLHSFCQTHSLSPQEQLSFARCKLFLWWEVYHMDLLWHLYTRNI